MINLSELKHAIRDETMRVGHPGFNQALARLVVFAEQRIYDGGGAPISTAPVRVVEMETRGVPLTAVDGVAALPADFLEARLILWDGDLKATPRYEPPASFRVMRSPERSGYPARYTIEGRDLLLSPMVSGSLVFDYYARPAALVADDDTSAMLLRYPALYFQAVLIEAYGYLRDDDRQSRAISAYTSIVNGLMETDVRRKSGGTHLAPRIPNARVR
jgi:hypothetical protein